MNQIHRTILQAAAVVAVSVVIAACDGDAGATPAPTATAVATPTPTAPPTPTAAPQADLSDAIRGTSMTSGPDLMARLDPSDPAQAANIADIEALLAATGARLDQLTLLNGVSLDGQAFVGGLRIDRGDIEIAKASYVQSTFDNLGEPRTEEAEIAGHQVTLIFDDADAGQPPLVVYAAADTVWLISGPEASAEAVLQALP